MKTKLRGRSGGSACDSPARALSVRRLPHPSAWPRAFWAPPSAPRGMLSSVYRELRCNEIHVYFFTNSISKRNWPFFFHNPQHPYPGPRPTTAPNSALTGAEAPAMPPPPTSRHQRKRQHSGKGRGLLGFLMKIVLASLSPQSVWGPWGRSGSAF